MTGEGSSNLIAVLYPCENADSVSCYEERGETCVGQIHSLIDGYRGWRDENVETLTDELHIKLGCDGLDKGWVQGESGIIPNLFLSNSRILFQFMIKSIDLRRP